MAELGINVAGRAEYPPADIAALGARWARCVAYPDADIREWIRSCHDRGVRVLLVLASESIGQAPNGWGPKIAHFGDLYSGLVDAWQIGNESDHVSDSSWTMSYPDLNRLLKTAREVLGGGSYLVGPGLVSGQPAWLQGVDLRPVDAIACHPYARWPQTPELRDLIDGYLAYKKPLWITEYHARTLGMAAYFKAQQSIINALAFCYSDGMVPGFGLIENAPALADFKAAAGPVGGGAMPDTFVVGDGMRALMAARGDTPAADEVYIKRGTKDEWSECIAVSGRFYRYCFSQNRTFSYQSEPGTP